MKARHGQHLQDDRLYECYLASRGDGVVDPPIADHLADCAACQSRYTEFAHFMDDVRQSADDTTAAMFPEERLHAQRGQIARRLEQLGHAARILSFPARIETTDDGQGRRVAPRWMMASAAAGLVVGIGLTALYDFGYHHDAVVTAEVMAPAASAPSPRQPLAAPIDDAVLLRQVDAAIGRQRTRALEPFQTLTPAYPEISTTAR